jgi:hypothetical protein
VELQPHVYRETVWHSGSKERRAEIYKLRHKVTNYHLVEHKQAGWQLHYPTVDDQHGQ